MDELSSVINTPEKYQKAFQVVTQSLWTGILEVRSGIKTKAAIEFNYNFVQSILKIGFESKYELSEVDEWWCTELIEAYEKIV